MIFYILFSVILIPLLILLYMALVTRNKSGYILQVAFRYVKPKRGKISLPFMFSFFWLAFTVTFFIVVISIFTGFQTQLKSSIFGFDPHLTIESRAGDGLIRGWPEHIEQIKRNFPKKVISAEPMIANPSIVRRYSLIDYVFLRGIYLPEENGYYSIPKSFPKIVTPALGFDKLKKGNNIFIGDQLALNLNVRIGSTIELIVPRGQFALRTGVPPRLKKFVIAGFFKSGNYDYDSRVVILPFNEAQSLYGIKKSTQQIVLKVEDIDQVDDVKLALRKILPYNNFFMYSVKDVKKSFFAALRLEKTIMSVIVCFFIFVGIVGIFISSALTVNARKKDIGILKTLGMSYSKISFIFTVNGYLTGLFGVTIGLGGGYLLATYLETILRLIESLLTKITGKIVTLIPHDVYYFDKLPISFDWQFISIVVCVGILVSGLASFLPALFAARLKPINIIRKGDV